MSLRYRDRTISGFLSRRGGAVVETKTELPRWPNLFAQNNRRSIPSSRFYKRFREEGQTEKRQVAIQVTSAVAGTATAEARSVYERAHTAPGNSSGCITGYA